MFACYQSCPRQMPLEAAEQIDIVGAAPTRDEADFATGGVVTQRLLDAQGDGRRGQFGEGGLYISRRFPAGEARL